ncbi:hypothetical protein DVH07_18240 [Hafnia paralvei]|uniref:hypothetical protein n=1 Tax=Hafnia paralvei TaxID=546367 RepID=UPI000DF4AA68|nr:hypothetical protein [Hafnia paralvei]RDA61890.1 hypothetical protein DU449_17800 [Hafnia paralvei]RDA62951.1 hypothetical protein DVH08_20010 [Hafnia paralvei]RDA63791.1 hypothetical protein DVH09_18370 [Hafnia paralvei]RDA75077.1 hypothetical protein DVH10_17540 [Hafnia paralvei]RDA75481.1 hypothetical protein DVH07_18240 [Hafnia paralvei]
MKIIQKKSFKFSQYRIQNSGGWCYGISAAIITHLRENIDGVISPEQAFNYVEIYSKMLTASYNKVMSSVTHGFYKLRKNILSIQNELNSPFHTPGSYVYNFNKCGIFLLLVNVDNLPHSFGENFQGRFSFFGQRANHAGVIIFAPDEIFIFDPNCGGVLFSWAGDNHSENMPVIIDMMLEQMYCLYDRMKGGRKAKIVSCITLDNPYFGKI